MKNYFFTYGTLQRGGALHNYIIDTNYEGRGRTEPVYELRSGGDFPAMVSGSNKIEGDVFSLDNENNFEELIRFLDRVENVPYLYTRQTIPVTLQDEQSILAQAFVANEHLFQNKNSSRISEVSERVQTWLVDRTASV